MSFPSWVVTEAQQDLYTDARKGGLLANNPILQSERQVRRFLFEPAGQSTEVDTSKLALKRFANNSTHYSWIATTQYQDRDVKIGPSTAFFVDTTILQCAYEWPVLTDDTIEDLSEEQNATSPLSGEVTTVQREASVHFPLFEAYLDNLLAHSMELRRTARYHDTRDKPCAAAGANTPDNSHFPRNVPVNGCCGIRFLGELKSRRPNAAFTVEEKEHIVGMGEQWLDLMYPLRQFIILYLTDLHYIQFFRVGAQRGKGFKITESVVMHLAGEGQQVLAGLYCGRDFTWGFSESTRFARFPDGSYPSYDKFLGRGSSGMVFADNTRGLAIKIFSDPELPLLEKDNYDTVYRNIIGSCVDDMQHVARMIPAPAQTFVTADAHCLVTPLGVPEVTYTVNGFCHLVDFLSLLHGQGMVFRDIKPSNLVTYYSAKIAIVRLVDYGAVCRRDISIEYEGTVHYASDRVLRSLAEEVQPKVGPPDDLHSLVRTAREVAAVSGQMFCSELDKIEECNYSAIRAFWNRKLVGFWTQATVAADAGDYNALKKFFSNLAIE